MNCISDLTLHIFLILPYPSYNQVPNSVLQTIKNSPVSHLLHMWGPATDRKLFITIVIIIIIFVVIVIILMLFFFYTMSLNPSNKMPGHFIVHIVQMSTLEFRAAEWFVQEYTQQVNDNAKAKPQFLQPASGVGQGMVLKEHPECECQRWCPWGKQGQEVPVCMVLKLQIA